MTTMTLRQLTATEAHVLDHFVDAVWDGDRARIAAEAPRAMLVFGGDRDKLERYVGCKLIKLATKPVEEYDDGFDILPARKPRLPFDADYDTVAEDPAVLREYLNNAVWPRDTYMERDMAPGTGDRLELGMKRRRNK